MRQAPSNAPGGDSFAQEIFFEVGTLARITDLSRPRPGLMLIQCTGLQRFEVTQHELLKHGLWVADVLVLGDDQRVPVPDDLQPVAATLQRVITTLGLQGTAPDQMPSSTQLVRPQPAAAGDPDFGCDQPVALLQVFGDVTVHGVRVSQASATPFILAAAGRPISTDELVELTGYAAKTFSSVYPASHPIVTRTNGMLALAPGVWTDHAWLAETVRRAAAAVQGDRDTEAADWLRQAFDLAGRIDGAPFERVPRSRREMTHGRRRDPWAWVDEFPYTVSARTHAGQEAVEATLAAAALWQAVKPTNDEMLTICLLYTSDAADE